MSVQIVNDITQATAITHAGVFHADEVLATVILEKAFGDVKLCRVNTLPETGVGDAIVYDIIGGKFDHHQKGGNGARENGISYASAGLVWKEYGPVVAGSTEDAETVCKRVDEELIQGIDAVDNGLVQESDSAAKCMNLSNVIHLMNPNWDDDGYRDEAFLEAVRWMEHVFDLVYKNVLSNLKAVHIVEEAIENSQDNIMVLDRFVPWQECVFASSNKKAAELHYVIFPSIRGGYNWRCVPDVLQGYGQRKPVPSAWYGLHDEELQKVTGVKTAVFCHPNGFMGSAETFEDAYALAVLAEQQ